MIKPAFIRWRLFSLILRLLAHMQLEPSYAWKMVRERKKSLLCGTDVYNLYQEESVTGGRRT
jgi:hypothetical protein